MSLPERDDHGIAAEVAGVAARYRLRLGAQRFRGRAGARRGHGVGSSQEFFDFRDYTPGDDLRYLDWRGYARTEQLRIRLHQEEVAPYVDVLIDTSASLGSTPGKLRAARLLAAALERWSRREGSAARALALGGGVVDATALAFGGGGAVPGLPQLALRPGGVRVLLSDGLWQDDPTPLLHGVCAGAGRVFCLQLLDPWELDPAAEGALTLIDCETAERREVQLDGRTIGAYRARVQRLIDGMRTTVIAQGGTFALVTADSLAAMCARDLLPAAVVEPA